MKKNILFLILVLVVQFATAQKNWFTTYPDSVALAKDANEISDRFVKDLLRINPKLVLKAKTIVHTTPYLIFVNGPVNDKTVHLPLWSQVIPEQQHFFNEVAGGTDKGKLAFGLFFNGFYLPHELGHALQDIVKGELVGSYENEYFANEVAMLWWRKTGREKELKQCYAMAKEIWNKLPNPVPAGISIEDYFRDNYQKAASDPYVYGYMQFKQFIQIYEDHNLPDFDTYVKNYIKK